ncbi:MAG: sulfotransferase [Litorimonas sp.]
MASSNLSHPLFGADLKTLLRLIISSGGVSPSKILLVFLLILSAIGRLPFTALEYLYVMIRRPKTEPIAPPIFILGHWRSGTTHLYNILSKSNKFGYVSPFSTALPWDILLIGRLFAPLLRRSLPDGRFIDNVSVTPDSPQEDEIALANMTPISYYQAIYFPKKFDQYFQDATFFDNLSEKQISKWERVLRYLYLKLTLDQDGRRLLIKNPVYTARVAHLRKMYPDAKFIHIHRNPYKVFVSMRNFYEKLLPQFALQDYSHLDIDSVVYKTYRRMMTSLKHETQDLPDSQYVELSFDDLQSDTMGQLQRIYSQLGLGDFTEDETNFTAYLESVADYQKNKFEISPDLKTKIDTEWGDVMALWGYNANS